MKAEHIVVDTRVAVLVKYACNAFRALKIDFADEIGTPARAFGTDGHEVMRLLCRDCQLNVSSAYLRPGFAFGGSCLRKDVLSFDGEERAFVNRSTQDRFRRLVAKAPCPATRRPAEACNSTPADGMGCAAASDALGTASELRFREHDA